MRRDNIQRNIPEKFADTDMDQARANKSPTLQASRPNLLVHRARRVSGSPLPSGKDDAMAAFFPGTFYPISGAAIFPATFFTLMPSLRSGSVTH